MCLWKTNSPGGSKDQIGYLSIKVTTKVSRSLTLVSFDKVSVVENAWKIWSLYLWRFKRYGHG